MLIAMTGHSNGHRDRSEMKIVFKRLGGGAHGHEPSGVRFQKVERYIGAGRWSSSWQVYREFDGKSVAIATGESYADARAAAVKYIEEN